MGGGTWRWRSVPACHLPGTWPSKLSFTSEIVRGYNSKFRLRVQGLAVALAGWRMGWALGL